MAKDRNWKWSGEKKTTAEMDEIAADAQNDIVNFELDDTTIENLKDWMEKWFAAGCGWKRLAKIIAKGV